jgi:transcriptional regulator with XRE-family HTH domain
MVDMDKKEQILHYHRIDGLSQREIARRVGSTCFKQRIERILRNEGNPFIIEIEKESKNTNCQY